MAAVLAKTALGLALALAGTARAQSLTNTGTQLTVAADALLAVPGALVNQAGGTLTTAGTVLVGGDFTNAGTVVPASGQVVFTGGADQTLVPGGATLPSLEVRNTGPAGQNRVLVTADLTVGQQLRLRSGLLRTAPTATVRLPDGATLTGEGPGRYVQGHLRVERSAVSGTVPLDFGHGFVLNPNGNALGTVRATRSAGLQTAGLSFAQNPANTSQHGIDRIWTVVPDQQPATPISLTFAWLPDDDNGLSFGSAQAWRLPDGGTAWQAVGSPASGAARSLTVSSLVLSRWTVSSLASPLPVELVSFTAERQGPDALLRWATASEKNNDRFEVESSLDGRIFAHLGTVLGRGSSSQPHAYSFQDPDLARYAAAMVYYRLRQVDRDGTASYSPVRPVQVPAGADFAVQAYPQPFTTTLSLFIRTAAAGPANIALHDAVGRALLTRAVNLLPGSTMVPLPEAAALPSGAYVLTISQNQYHRTVKVVRE